MMEDLNGYQKGILIVMLVMVLIYAFLYPKTISTVGYRYKGTIMVQTQQNGATVYTGKIQGQQAQFTVRSLTVSFRYGDKDYGEYTLKYDYTAVPKEHENASSMTGIEICHNGEIMFRGGVWKSAWNYALYDEDGSYNGFQIYVGTDDVIKDQDGNEIDSMAPTARTIYDLLHDPELTHEGTGWGWIGGALICFFNAVGIIWADELFCWKMSIHVRNAELTEPSDWEIACRYVGWTIAVLVAWFVFAAGLQ